ncbi:MAG: DUF4389 domain-containing protein [Pseudomonadota bacterium]|jgi:hypothetical protein
MNEPNPAMSSPSEGSGTTQGAGTGVNQELIVRIIYMLVFAFVFWLVCWGVAITAVAQIVLRLLKGQPNAELTRFGGSLARYAGQIVAYLTFASERVPFPFSEWPDHTSGSDLSGL